MSEISTVDVGQEQIEAALSAFGEIDDPMAILARRVAEHQAGRVSDVSVPVYAFLMRWSITLESGRLAAFSRQLQRIAGFAGDIGPVVEVTKHISMIEHLGKGVEVKGG